MATVVEVFDEIRGRMDAGEISAIALVTVDTDGRVFTSMVADRTRSLALLAALDISKDRLKAEMIANGQAAS